MYKFIKASLVLGAGLALSVSANTDDNKDENVQQICHSSGSKIGLESSKLETMVMECTSQLKGYLFDTEEPLTDDDAYVIEEQCATEAQQDNEENFDQLFEACASREVIAYLQKVGVYS